MQNYYFMKVTLDTLPKRLPDLDQARNRYALRIPKGSAEKILIHKAAPALFAYLELKPLFVCSVICSDQGRIPYKKIAEFLRLSVSGTRAKIRTLERYRLVRIDRDKNIILGSYQRFRKVIKHEGKHSYKILNNGDTKEIIKATALTENLNRQKFVLSRKIISYEWFNNTVENSANAKEYLKFSECPERIISKANFRKYKKILGMNWDYELRRWEKVYNERMKQTAIEFPKINTNVTLSRRGIARILGKKAISTGHYQMKKLVAAGLFKDTGIYITVSDRSPAIYEAMTGQRTDIFSYQYPTLLTHSGLIRKYFRNCTNQLETRVNTIFF